MLVSKRKKILNTVLSTSMKFQLSVRNLFFRIFMLHLSLILIRSTLKIYDKIFQVTSKKKKKGDKAFFKLSENRKE